MQEVHKANVVGQLRYEYALNLIQKLGISFTRIGLGFHRRNEVIGVGGSKRVKFSAIDVFCGCGGLSLGLQRAGFKIVAAIDNDGLSTSTYQMNHRRAHLVNQDIRLIDPGMLMRECGLSSGDLDLMAGCPPCQGFSTLRTLNGGRDVDEPMNDLVYEFVRFVRVFMPKALMMENVPALLRDARLEDITSELDTLGYTCAANLFNAERYGVPQRRRRMILFGARGDCPPFPSPCSGTAYRRPSYSATACTRRIGRPPTQL